MARFSDVFEDITKLGRKIPKEDYLLNGNYQIIDQGQNEIAGYSNDPEGLYTDVPVIIFGDHTRVLKFVDEPLFLGADGVKMLKIKNPSNNPRYLYYALCNARIPDTGYNRHFKWLKEIEIPIPDVHQQHNIAVILDKVSNLIILRKQQLAKLDDLVKSRFIELFGDPETNPKGWEKGALSNHLNVVGGYAFKSELFAEDGIPVLRIGNINAGFFQPTNMVYWKYDDSLLRYMMHSGDLVMSLTGTVGKDDYGNVCILGDEYECYYLNQRNAKLELFSTLDKYYLSQALKFSAIKKKLTGISRGVRQANISNRDILNLEIPIPPIDLQNEFAAFVEQTDKSKSAVKKSLEKLETLKKSLMQQYFG